VRELQRPSAPRPRHGESGMLDSILHGDGGGVAQVHEANRSRLAVGSAPARDMDSGARFLAHAGGQRVCGVAGMRRSHVCRGTRDMQQATLLRYAERWQQRQAQRIADEAHRAPDYRVPGSVQASDESMLFRVTPVAARKLGGKEGHPGNVADANDVAKTAVLRSQMNVGLSTITQQLRLLNPSELASVG
jgi:AraC-like DNA-binding protein